MKNQQAHEEKWRFKGEKLNLASIEVVVPRERETIQNAEDNFNSLCILVWLKMLLT